MEVLNLENEDYSFKEFEDCIGIVDYIGKSTNVVIPDYINDKPVVAIFKNAFYKKGLTAVTLPNLVHTLGEDAFYTNELKEIIIPENLTNIQGGAFGRNNIEKIEFKSKIESLPMFCFIGNALKTLDLPASLKFISNDCFAENEFEELVIPEHVTDIIADCFAQNSKLKKVTLPAKFEGSIKSIFKGCDIDNIEFNIV